MIYIYIFIYIYIYMYIYISSKQLYVQRQQWKHQKNETMNDVCSNLAVNKSEQIKLYCGQVNAVWVSKLLLN